MAYSGYYVREWNGLTMLGEGVTCDQEIGGNIYSTTIRSGEQGAATYTELGSGGSDPLRVVENGKVALNIWSSGGGLLQFYDTNLNTMCGQILPTESFYGTGGLKIHGRNSTGYSKSVAIVGSTIYLDPGSAGGEEVTVLGNLTILGNIAVFGAGKGCIVTTESYGRRWLYAVEGSEIRLEEKGCGVLIDGQCRIELTSKFLQTIEKDLPEAPWVIDVTPYFKGKLYISEIGENYFIVSDCDDTMSSGRFAWSLSAVKIGCIGVYMPEFQPEGDILTSNWEDDLL